MPLRPDVAVGSVGKSRHKTTSSVILNGSVVRSGAWWTAPLVSHLPTKRIYLISLSRRGTVQAEQAKQAREYGRMRGPEKKPFGIRMDARDTQQLEQGCDDSNGREAKRGEVPRNERKRSRQNSTLINPLQTYDCMEDSLPQAAQWRDTDSISEPSKQDDVES